MSDIIGEKYMQIKDDAERSSLSGSEQETLLDSVELYRRQSKKTRLARIASRSIALLNILILGVNIIALVYILRNGPRYLNTLAKLVPPQIAAPCE